MLTVYSKTILLDSVLYFFIKWNLFKALLIVSLCVGDIIYNTNYSCGIKQCGTKIGY